MDYNKNINFIIAGAFANFKKIAEHYVKNRNYVKYKSYNSVMVYDGICNCKWNGGRPNDLALSAFTLEMDKQKETYYKMGWGISLVFTNPKIDLSDEVGLFLLDKFHREGNGVILVNEELRNFIREKYPKYRITYSITGGPCHGSLGESEIAFYKEKQRTHDLIVPRPEANSDRRLVELDLKKVEILLNDSCVYNCCHFREHFDAIAEVNEKQLQNTLSEEALHRKIDCWLDVETLNRQTEKDKKTYGSDYGMMLSPKNIKRLINLGVSHFKIQGRVKNTDPCIIDELDRYILDYNQEYL